MAIKKRANRYKYMKEKIEIPCWVCDGVIIKDERTPLHKRHVCFECKKERRTKREREYRLKKLSTA